MSHSSNVRNDGLTPFQERAVSALLTARSIAAAARQAKVGESSIRRWLHEDENFQLKLRRLRDESLARGLPAPAGSLRSRQSHARCRQGRYQCRCPARIDHPRGRRVRLSFPRLRRRGRTAQSRRSKATGGSEVKHWCFYTRVVTYLEKVEALFPDKKRKGAYLLWRDDDGNPLMIAGPGVDWFQGCSPMPDLNNLGQAVASPAAKARIATAEAWTEVHARVGTRADAPRRQPRANSKRPNASKQQSRRRKPAVHPSSTTLKTTTPPAPAPSSSPLKTAHRQVQPISGKQPCKHRQPKQQSHGRKPVVDAARGRNPNQLPIRHFQNSLPRHATPLPNQTSEQKALKSRENRSNPLKSAQIPPRETKTRSAPRRVLPLTAFLHSRSALVTTGTKSSTMPPHRMYRNSLSPSKVWQ